MQKKYTYFLLLSLFVTGTTLIASEETTQLKPEKTVATPKKPKKTSRKNNYYKLIHNQKRTVENWLKKSAFAQGVISGIIAQVTVETGRQFLPEKPDLMKKTGLCRDRLTGMGTLTIGTALYYYMTEKLSAQGLAGVLTGSISAALIRNYLGLNPHELKRIPKSEAPEKPEVDNNTTESQEDVQSEEETKQ